MSASRRDFLTYMGVGTCATLLGGGTARSEGPEGTPLALYPRLEARLRGEADKRANPLAPGGGLRLDASRAAFAPAIDRLDVEPGRSTDQPIPPDGFLTFAVDASEAMYVKGVLSLLPDDDLRPGLRAYVLCDATLIAAPMLAADAWGTEKVTDPAPVVAGAEPPRTLPLQEWLLPRGRHYLTIAGPHLRPAGRFVSLTVETTGRTVQTPLYQFALITDTHVRYTGRPEWMNVKMGDAVPAELTATLNALAREGIAFALHGGDMTESATRDEFALLARLLKEQPLPVYGCLGNHDAYHASSRPDAQELLAAHFPGGALDYALAKPPVRFVVLDEDIKKPEHRERKQAWLRNTLAADTTTPTLLVWHYAPYNRGGISSCGFRMEDWSALGKEAVLEILQGTPNVVATLNGHDHWDEVNQVQGITHVQNAAFVEWPNSYRVFRVYPDRLEWEVRQVANRGFIRESFAVPKALSWMIATREGDLTGAISLRRTGGPGQNS